MFLRCTKRKKAGKEHHYWSLVENKRVGGGRVVQRHVLYLGEINDSQQAAECKSIEIFEEGKARPTTVALFLENGLARSMTSVSSGCGWRRWPYGGRGNGGLAG